MSERRAVRLLSIVFGGLIAAGLLFVAAPDWIGLAWLNGGVDRAFFGAADPTAGALDVVIALAVLVPLLALRASPGGAPGPDPSSTAPHRRS